MFDRRNLRWPLEVVIRPAADADPATLDQAIAELSGEHPRFMAIRDRESLSILLGACDNCQLEENLALLRGKIPGSCDVGALEVGLRETISQAAQAEHSHRDSDGSRFARVKLAIEPLGARLDFRFENKAAGTAVPKNVVPGIERGLQSLLNGGLWSEYPLIGVKASLLDGACDDAATSATSFEVASRAAFREAVLKAAPILLEPVSKVLLVTPEDTKAALTADLENRRGRVTGMESRDGGIRLEALVPITHLLGYANSLAHMTQGRASYTVEFSHYERTHEMKGDGPPSPNPASAALRAS